MATYFSNFNAIKTCTLDTANANRIRSDRFLNPSNMVCPSWNGYDNLGRRICKNSFSTVNPGCNSALERVNVENDITRPQYLKYIGGGNCSDVQRSQGLKYCGYNVDSGPHFGYQHSSVIRTACPLLGT